MNDKVNIQKELDKLAPELAELKKETMARPSVPEGYFNSLTDTILRRAGAESEAKQKDKLPKATLTVVRKRSLGRSINSSMRLALAACFLLLLGGAYWAVFVMPKTSINYTASIDQLGREEIDEYIEDNISDFDLSLMLEAEMVNSVAVGNLFAGEIPAEDMDAYLDELLEGIDLEELEEAL